MKKKILILGAGNAQIDAIEYCKSRGYEVVGCSYTAVDNGIPYLDYFEQVDIKSVEGVVELAKKYDVAAIYSVGSDVAMPTVMKASEILGLPHFISSETAEICHSKSAMRKKLGKDFRGNIPFLECSSIEQAYEYNDFPAMMKPTDSQGQRGCFRVDSKEDIRKEFQTSMNFSNEHKVIIEKYVEGPEISVNAYFQDGQLRCAVVSDRVAFDEYPGGIIKEHIIPSHLDKEIQAETIDMICDAARLMNIDNGPCYFQIKMDRDKPIILEITPRLDGCHMWNLIKHYCGADLLDASFRHLVEGEQVLTQEIKMPDTEYKLVFMSQAPWTKFNKKDFDCSNAEYYFYYYEDGNKVRRLNGYVEKCGYMIYKA